MSAPLTAAQQRVLDVLTVRGYAEVAMQTNTALGTVHNGATRALQDRGLVRVWQRKHSIEAVLPASERDYDVDGVAS